MAVYETPGVIIEEITSPGVIAGVGTSTGGFIGKALDGPIGEVHRVTSWEEFQQRYGLPDGSVYVADPPGYLAHAVSGFFANGGRDAYICRAGAAKHGAYEPPQVNGIGPALRIEALAPGAAGNTLKVTIVLSSIVDHRKLALPSAAIDEAKDKTKRILLKEGADASQFSVGDIVWRDNGAKDERLTVQEIRPTTREIFVAEDLQGNATGNLRAAKLLAGTRRLRLSIAGGLSPGSVITIEPTNPQPANPPAGQPPMNPETAVVASVAGDTIMLEGGLAGEFLMSAANAITVTSKEFDLTVIESPTKSETQSGLSTSRRHPRYYETAFTSQLVRLLPPGPPAAGPLPDPTKPPDDRPQGTANTLLVGGVEDDPSQIGAAQYSAAIDAFNDIDDVNFLAVPDDQTQPTQRHLIDHCVNLADRVAILDTPRGIDRDAALVHRGLVESENGFAALYHPWLLIPDPLSATGETMPVPPCGHVAGIYARVDQNPGVHKAPANETVRGAVDLVERIGDSAQAPLNVAGVNVIRTFPGSAVPIVWGARTTVQKDNTDWRYVNVRRLLCFIEESLQEGLRGALFRPNDLTLWAQLRRAITGFLTDVWRDGALFGAAADQAFNVRIDEAINPPRTRALGQLFIEVRVAPVRPAEFIVVRIALFDGEAQVIE